MGAYFVAQQQKKPERASGFKRPEAEQPAASADAEGGKRRPPQPQSRPRAKRHTEREAGKGFGEGSQKWHPSPMQATVDRSRACKDKTSIERRCALHRFVSQSALKASVRASPPRISLPLCPAAHKRMRIGRIRRIRRIGKGAGKHRCALHRLVSVGPSALCSTPQRGGQFRRLPLVFGASRTTRKPTFP